MANRNNSASLRTAYRTALLFCAAAAACFAISFQAQAQTPATNRLGTVKSISGETLTLVTDAGQTETVTVPSQAKVLQLAVGSTDLKTAKPSQLSDIAVGDRVLASGSANATAVFTARLVVVMKHGEIAQMQAAQRADWQAHGVGGIVDSVDPANGTIVLMSGKKKLTIHTSSKTEFRRFAGDSVKYEDSKPGTFSQIQPKDELQARGAKSADGLSMEAEEVVSGSFLNLSGLITTIDPATGTITLKDLATKQVMTVDVTANTDIRTMPLEAAMQFAARSNGGGGGRRGGGGSRGGGSRGGGPRGGGPRGGGGAQGQGSGMQRSASEGLAQMVASLPKSTLADLKTGDAVMIVASAPSPGSSTVTAITLLSGVEPILTANPNGGMDLSMSLGGGGGGGGDDSGSGGGGGGGE